MFEDAQACLSTPKKRVYSILSHLKRAGWLTVFGRRGRKRLYRLVRPNDAFFALEKMQHLKQIEQQRYIPLLIKTCRNLWWEYKEDFLSFVLYGSVARGDASTTSDVDILLVMREGKEKSVGRRLDALYGAVREIESERDFLRHHDILTDVSFYPLTKKEAARLLPLYLDISHEGILLYDPQDFFHQLMVTVKYLMQSYGVERKEIGEQWFWELGPNFEIAEIDLEV
ncbi:MAG: nucleotidyltransferase domain-containing protein [Candidatus Korarchaeota archaeon]|nr:nucleotidyltransferase domain-containing protein [Candidatus Korarchaeota archaeon]NIU85282.1 hypothetical protein [Candidatus Thorarchaeota archaeon]NIW15379.1 hypothetical protein [Candidatus Thorarchaeota archaeon]NIW53326.1 hypothetical protein [Candidatus Korarchaeota archaeon]